MRVTYPTFACRILVAFTCRSSQVSTQRNTKLVVSRETGAVHLWSRRDRNLGPASLRAEAPARNPRGPHGRAPKPAQDDPSPGHPAPGLWDRWTRPGGPSARPRTPRAGCPRHCLTASSPAPRLHGLRSRSSVGPPGAEASALSRACRPGPAPAVPVRGAVRQWRRQPGTRGPRAGGPGRRRRLRRRQRRQDERRRCCGRGWRRPSGRRWPGSCWAPRCC